MAVRSSPSNDPPTQAERIFVEHWSRRKMSLLRTYVLTGVVLWGLVMLVAMEGPTVLAGHVSPKRLVVAGALYASGGAVFGLFLWAVSYRRYRRLACKVAAADTNSMKPQ